MNNSIENSISTKELFTEYEWYKEQFSDVVQQACDDFFGSNFQIKFIGLSKNINCLLNDEACFVTKVKIEKDYDMFFRLSEKAVSIILDRVLGKSKNRFNLNTISELETKIITSFNAHIFEKVKDIISSPDPKELSRSNFDMINLTFILTDNNEEVNTAGKVVITLPVELLNARQVVSASEKFSKDDFSQSEVTVKIKVGKTSFSLYDIKNLEVGDLVVFENSNIHELKLSIFGEELDINIYPNMNILIAEEINQEGDNMAQNHNLWDSIEVEMHAEFDAVKITLGELKNIEQGLVVDLASLYNNNLTLRVEGKDIATGSLVIVNDRYGVKINEILATNEAAQAPQIEQNETYEQTESYENPEFESEEQDAQEQEEYSSEEYENDENAEQEISQEENEEDFDYSDFELEDENI